MPWTRPDATFSFRWDPHEDVRYALRATDPTDSKTREKTQHGANRLTAIGLSALTVVPQRRSGRTRLRMLGGKRGSDAFVFTWPIWKDPISLAAIRSLLGHPCLDDPATRQALGIVERLPHAADFVRKIHVLSGRHRYRRTRKPARRHRSAERASCACHEEGTYDYPATARIGLRELWLTRGIRNMSLWFCRHSHRLIRKLRGKAHVVDGNPHARPGW